jgi:hypothetical protein
LDSFLLGCALDRVLKAVKEHLEKLLNIHLLEHVCWLALPILEGVTEALRIYVLLLRFEQACKERLELIEHVFIWLLVFMIWVFNRKNILSEPWYHVQLLEERDHVTDAAEILDANKAS